MPNTDAYILEGLAPGIYLLSVVDGLGCESSISVTVGSSGPSIPFVVNCSSGPSSGTDGTIEIVVTIGTSPYVVEWEGPSPGSMTFSGVGPYIIPNLATGFYSLIMEDGQGKRANCSSFVGEQLPPINTCIGDCVTIGVPDATCFKWEPTIGLSDPNSSQTEACITTNTEYKLTILNEEGDIIEVKNYTVEIGNPKITVSPSPGIICGNEDVLLEGDAGFSTYEWRDEAGAIVSTSAIYTASVAGTYHLVVTDENGCSAETDVGVVDASDPENVKAYLEEQGFIYIPINVLDDYPTLAPPTNVDRAWSALTTVDDCVQKIIQYDSTDELVGLRDVIEFDLLKAEEAGFTGTGKIIGYEDFCNNNSSCSGNSFFDVQDFDCSIQGYIYDEPNSMDDYLMVKVNVLSKERISALAYLPQPIELEGKKGDCGFGTLSTEPCLGPWGPDLGYAIAKDGDDSYGYNCVNGEWVQGDIVEIKRKDELLDFRDNCWGNQPLSEVYSVALVVTPLGPLVTAHYPSAIAYWYVKTPILTQTIEDHFLFGFDADVFDYQEQKDVITNHFIEGFPIPGPVPGPDTNCDNESSNTPLIWDCNSPLSNGLFDANPTKVWANQIRGVYVDWFAEGHRTLDELFLSGNNSPQGNVNFGGVDPVKIEHPFWTYQVFGGTQEFTVETTNFEGYKPVGNGKTIFTCNVHLTVTDTFGANLEDAERWYLPGLPAFWVLQHFRNGDSSGSSRCGEAPCYIPFKHSVIIPYEFTNKE